MTESDEYPELSEIQVNEKGKQFLQALFDLGGEATTNEIRRRTGLDNSIVKYRFKKFESAGIIEYEYEDEENPKYHNPQKIAYLTERGEQFIQQGFAGGEIFDEERKKKVELTLEEYESLLDTVESLESRLDVLETDLANSGTVSETDVRKVLMDIDFPDTENLQNRIDTIETKLTNRIEQVEDESLQQNKVETRIDDEMMNRLEEVESDVDYFYGWIQKTEVFLLALKLLYDDQNVKLQEYIESAKEQASNE